MGRFFNMERRAILVRGVVQGVGFRPFVFGLASRLQLRGFVKNQSGGLQIEVEGEAPSLDSFLTELTSRPPPLAQIDRLSWQPRPFVGEAKFRIEPSDRGASGPIFISPDVATCDDCLAELFNPLDRRYRYPFLNCTNCGPRLTIVTGAPYDRERTTMAGFRLCPACRAEYEDPTNRRFHAQPTACSICGPRLELLTHGGETIECDDPIVEFAGALQSGHIGAMKGLGGYHLVCDAHNAAAVAKLRTRKMRDEKPFAVMVKNTDAAALICEIAPLERRLLTSPRRPIVLLRKRLSQRVSDAVAPGNPSLGVMLPYTPAHHLLFDAMPTAVLVMTSGNRSDEPIAFDDSDARERLGEIADLFLTHNRPIHVRCDDSVTRIVANVESPVRRSRGDAPRPVRLPVNLEAPTLAVGGQFKGTFALGRERQAFLSHHLGDLDHFQAFRAFENDIRLYQQLFEIQPRRIAHALHPDYASTRYAKSRADEGIELIPIQHHHAHMASCMAENSITEPVIGVTFDGTGFGTDGAIWGGEFLVGDYSHFRRAAHLRYVPMPGGDRAIKEPWRIALSHVRDATGETRWRPPRIDAASRRTVEQMLDRKFNTPDTSSAGRLFDAIASLAGVRDRVSYEGQAAMQLEWLAGTLPVDGRYPFQVDSSSADFPLMIDTRPLIRAVLEDANDGVEAASIARRFHSTLVQIVADVCRKIRQATRVNAVVLSGGVFMNALLTTEVVEALTADDFRVFRHRIVPPNDGGLCLGQLMVAASVKGDESSQGESRRSLSCASVSPAK